MFAYPVGWLFWKTFAKAGVPLSFKVKVTYHDDEKVFVAESDDFFKDGKGFIFVCDGYTEDELAKNIQMTCEDALEEIFAKDDAQSLRISPRFSFPALSSGFSAS